MLSSRAELVNSFEGVVIQAVLPYSVGMTFPVDNRTQNLGNAIARDAVTRFLFSSTRTSRPPTPS